MYDSTNVLENLFQSYSDAVATSRRVMTSSRDVIRSRDKLLRKCISGLRRDCNPVTSVELFPVSMSPEVAVQYGDGHCDVTTCSVYPAVQTPITVTAETPAKRQKKLDLDETVRRLWYSKLQTGHPRDDLVSLAQLISSYNDVIMMSRTRDQAAVCTADDVTSPCREEVPRSSSSPRSLSRSIEDNVEGDKEAELRMTKMVAAPGEFPMYYSCTMKMSNGKRKYRKRRSRPQVDDGQSLTNKDHVTTAKDSVDGSSTHCDGNDHVTTSGGVARCHMCSHTALDDTELLRHALSAHGHDLGKTLYTLKPNTPRRARQPPHHPDVSRVNSRSSDRLRHLLLHRRLQTSPRQSVNDDDDEVLEGDPTQQSSTSSHSILPRTPAMVDVLHADPDFDGEGLVFSIQSTDCS